MYIFNTEKFSFDACTETLSSLLWHAALIFPVLHRKNIEVAIPKPHKFTELPLRSSISELAELTAKINELLPQFSDFISQFNNIIISNSINVIIDTSGNMTLDAPITMSDLDAQNITKRIGIIDRLIITRGQEIDQLLQKGLSIEADLKKENVNYTSQILDKVNEFKRLNSSYKQ
uniref:Uncharacterized protein n=1 Tax=Ilyonectria sp. TaxID=1755430 RepID=A0A4Y5UZ99_9HYPO|nr:hypothetical protein [Ilyonectria sp.]